MGRGALWIGTLYYLVWICTVVPGIGIAYSQSPTSHETSKKDILDPANTKFAIVNPDPSVWSEFSLTTGIRTDELKWSIAASNINILSELDWSSVDSYQVIINNHTCINDIFLRGQFNYAWIIDGTLRDSDYGQNNRIAEWSRSISESTGDQLWDISIGGGYAIRMLQDRLTVLPLLGIFYHKQNLRIQNGMQALSRTNTIGGSNPPPVGPLSNRLNSSYFARWIGPWIGLDLFYQPELRPPVHHAMELRLSIELGWADYYGEGNWNLRGDLEHPKSFEHKANGIGFNLTGQMLINIFEKWYITFSANHQHWSTEKGIDRKFLSNGGTSTTQLNEVRWTSSSFMVGTAYQF